jgi:ferric-dicitrate binding protein FerR (iron transport regulator)
MVCVAVCQAQDALQFSLVPRKAPAPSERWRRRTIRPAAFVAVLACILFGLVLVAKATGHWQTNLPREMYIDLVSHANDAAHPGM